MLIFRSYIKLPQPKGIATQIVCCSFRSQSPVGLTPINTGIGIIAKHDMWFCQIGNQEKYIGFYDLNTSNPRDLASKIHMERTWHILNDEGNTVCFSFTFAFYHWNNSSIYGNHQSWRQNRAALHGMLRCQDGTMGPWIPPYDIPLKWGGWSAESPFKFCKLFWFKKKATKTGSDPYTIHSDIFSYGSCHWDTVSMIHKYSSYAFKPIHVLPGWLPQSSSFKALAFCVCWVLNLPITLVQHTPPNVNDH